MTELEAWGARQDHIREFRKAPVGRPSLVDSAERAVRAWLAPGRYRQGDRLPPEHELAGMLGISRGTLRTALRRLELSGEIVRRQGSGTFVGQITAPGAFGEQLQRLESYSAFAQRQGITLTVEDLVIEHEPADKALSDALHVDTGEVLSVVSRTLIAGDDPMAVMHDVFHPDVRLPDDRILAKRLREGETILDQLASAGVAVSWSRTLITPLLLGAQQPLGRRLGLCAPTACLELEELVYAGQAEPVLFSRDVFTPEGIEVEVMRSVDAPRPGPISPAQTPAD